MTREEYDEKIAETKQYRNGCLMALDISEMYIASLESRLVEVWEPTEGEWCLFWDNEESKNAILAKFVGTSESGLFKSGEYASWKYCIKFTGELPKHLKT